MQIKKKYTWLVTGAAGFIGSNLVERLLKENQKVIGIDNFITGKKKNIYNLKRLSNSSNFKFIRGDIKSRDFVNKVTKKIDFVLHNAALGSVNRSIKYPEQSFDNNVLGFFNILNAAKDNKVKKFIYASSSSVYGDSASLPKKELFIGKALSPYATTKYINEELAYIYSKTYKLETVGLRYFNVFGKNQDPKSIYAAVIPKWIDLLKKNKTLKIFGDGKNSRDFCYVANVVEACILVSLKKLKNKFNIYNVACGERISLIKLSRILNKLFNENKKLKIRFSNPRKGDIKHSIASIKKISDELGYSPKFNVVDGLRVLKDL
jgi:UDP-N-acetylglucosamine 4-epimerase